MEVLSTNALVTTVTSDLPGSAGILDRFTMAQLSSLKRNSGLNEGGIMSRVTIARTALLAVLFSNICSRLRQDTALLSEGDDQGLGKSHGHLGGRHCRHRC
jgi:hypothetical protein